MRCPVCQAQKTSVRQSRPSDRYNVPVQRRRRECLKCGHAFSTLEFVVGPELEGTSPRKFTILVMDLPGVIKARNLIEDAGECALEVQKHLLKFMEL